MDKYIKVEKLEHDLMKSVLNGSLTVKEFNKVSAKIHDRCNYIVRKAFEIQGISVNWYDFDNEGGEDGDCGYFDPERYEKNFYITGDFNGDMRDCLYSAVFPTKWLWNDFEDELTKEIEDHRKSIISKKIERKAKNAERKQQKEKLIESALSKLTKEEIKALGY